MKRMGLEEIREAIHGRWLTSGKPTSVQSVTIDTRTAQPGELFVAIRGQRYDGHMFLPEAARAGCVAALVALDGEPRPEVAELFAGGILAVPDTTAALGSLGSYHRGLVAATVVGVTGSNGKTTVKRMIDRILSRRFVGSCAPKSFNNAIGVPLTLLGAGGGDDYIICELGSSCPGEIAALAALARPDLAVITSVAETHLEQLGSLQRVAAEKASILHKTSADGLAVVSADNELLDRAIRAYDVRLVRFGESGTADLRLTGYEVRGRGGRFQLNNRLWVDLPLPGRHNALNALAAIAVAQRLGFSQEAAAEALADIDGMEMRLEWVDCGSVTVINDAYNANPASMLAAAAVLAETEAKRRVIIAGDMHELGEQTEALHIRTGGRIAEHGLDLLIGVGSLGRCIAKGASEAGLAVEVFDSVERTQRALGKLLQPGDVVLLKASRAVELERLCEPIRSALARKTRRRKKRKKGSKR